MELLYFFEFLLLNFDLTKASFYKFNCCNIDGIISFAIL
jgi:hypothetical protein